MVIKVGLELTSLLSLSKALMIYEGVVELTTSYLSLGY